MPKIVIDLLPWEQIFLGSAAGAVVLGGAALVRRSRRLGVLAGVSAAVALVPWLVQPNFGELLQRAGSTNITETSENATRPELRPLIVSQDQATVFRAVFATVNKLGWLVVEEDEAAGTVHAAVPVAGIFTDDLRVQLSAGAGGTVVNVRSNARVGRGDFGVNRRHVVQFLLVLQEQLGR